MSTRIHFQTKMWIWKIPRIDLGRLKLGDILTVETTHKEGESSDGEKLYLKSCFAKNVYTVLKLSKSSKYVRNIRSIVFARSYCFFDFVWNLDQFNEKECIFLQILKLF